MGILKEFDCVDKFGNKVSCSKERWRHIVKEHPILDGMQELVRVSIRSAYGAIYYPQNPDRLNLHKPCVLPNCGNTIIIVVLEYNQDMSKAKVISAWNAARVKLGGKLVWGNPI